MGLLVEATGGRSANPSAAMARQQDFSNIRRTNWDLVGDLSCCFLLYWRRSSDLLIWSSEPLARLSSIWTPIPRLSQWTFLAEVRVLCVET